MIIGFSYIFDRNAQQPKSYTAETTIDSTIQKQPASSTPRGTVLSETTNEYTPEAAPANTVSPHENQSVPQNPPPKIYIPEETLSEKPISNTALKTQSENLAVVSNEDARAATVNIFCTTKYGGSFNPASGSGIIIDKRGVILTNAHVAYYFLREDYPVDDFIDCVIRTGSPARNTYRANLLYLPTQWVKDNAKLMAQGERKSLGENDFALLLITESTNPEIPLPDSFPFIPPDIREEMLVPGVPVMLSGYPAEFLGGITVALNLYPVTTLSTIQSLYYISDSNNIDIVDFVGNIAAQDGSSGGGAINLETGTLLGIVATRTTGDTTEDRDLNALTLSYVNRDMIAELGVSLADFLAGELAETAKTFNQNVVPALTEILVRELP